MNNLDNFPLILQMDKDKTEIEEFELEPNKGTKRMKEKFFLKASGERNALVEGKIQNYQELSTKIVEEMRQRFTQLMPSDCTDSYQRLEEDVSHYLSFVVYDSDSSPSFKLGLDLILASITDLTSLEELNEKIGMFLKKFEDFGLPLTLDDFTYTMFTESYMKTFLENSDKDSIKASFEEIYFKCPDIKLQLKMNLEYIIQKYDSKLSEVVTSLKEKYFKEYAITEEDNIIERYIHLRLSLGRQKATDEYYNTRIFLDGKKKIADYLDGSPARMKVYNKFAMNGDYDSYNEGEKREFDAAMMGFYLTLSELKKFYRYESILNDLVSFYKEKDHAKNDYLNKKKEIEKEEKNRASIYQNYVKASRKGFLKKVKPEKQKQFMLQMNEEIRKLHDLYEEEKNLDVRYKVSLLAETASIYDIFLVSLQSFSFLEKSFAKEEFEDLELKDNLLDFLKFIYNPDNLFLRKVNGFVDYNVVDIVAEKYHLLNLNITSEDISKDNIDGTLQDASFINFVENVEASKITFSTISHLYEMDTIFKSLNDEK